jgi:TDG/mug DNA glycosylase family protein
MDRATRSVYEARAAEWAQKRTPRYGPAAAALAGRSLPDLPVADLGCGPGSYFEFLGRPAGGLVGLDGALAMTRLAREAAPDVPAVQADLARLPFRRGSLGGAWARASYLHLPRADLPAALAHLHGTLALGAPVEMTLRAGTGEGTLPDDDFAGRFFSHWQADELRAVLEGGGFTVDSLVEEGEWLIARATRAHTLPDFVGPGMRILVCGLNPSVLSADAGFGYARATNRFWGAAIKSGLMHLESRHQPLRALAVDHVGMTDLVKRPTPRASELTRDEYRDGAARVATLVRWLQPRLTLFVGLDGWRVAVDRLARPGLQPERFGGALAYVMPSTSGLNARTLMAEHIEHMQAAMQAADRAS